MICNLFEGSDNQYEPISKITIMNCEINHILNAAIFNRGLQLLEFRCLPDQIDHFITNYKLNFYDYDVLITDSKKVESDIDDVANKTSIIKLIALTNIYYTRYDSRNFEYLDHNLKLFRYILQQKVAQIYLIKIFEWIKPKSFSRSSRFPMISLYLFASFFKQQSLLLLQEKIIKGIIFKYLQNYHFFNVTIKLGLYFYSAQFLILLTKVSSYLMGIALYKADFLYPKKQTEPLWFKHEDVGPYLGDQENPSLKQQLPKQQQKIQKPIDPAPSFRQMAFKSTYEDYSEQSLITFRSQSLNNGSKIEVEKKIFLLPAAQNGPVLLSFRKEVDEELKMKSLASIKSSLLTPSRKSSEISLNSHESKTILAKQTLQPSIRQILADTPSKGQCVKFMQKGKEAWKVQNYQKSIEYLLKGLEMCHIEHPMNYFEKGIYHKRLGANYRLIFNDQKAIQHLKEAIKYFEMEAEPQIIEIALVLNNMGVIYQQQNRLQQALDNFGKSLELKRQFLPENHEEIASRLCNIGLLQWSIGQHKKSVDSYAEALHINKIVYGSTHHEVAKNYYNLSLCLFGIEQFGLWLDYHYESLRIMKRLGLTQTSDYKQWMSCFKVKFRQFLAHQKHRQDLVIKSLGMMALILDKDDQIQFFTSIKEDLENV